MLGSSAGLAVTIDTSVNVVLESPLLVIACIKMAYGHRGAGGLT